jgi:hypothetical protein
MLLLKLAQRLIVRAHDRVVAERGDDPRAMSGRKPRQRCDIEMIVVRVRNQNDIDCNTR